MNLVQLASLGGSNDPQKLEPFYNYFIGKNGHQSFFVMILQNVFSNKKNNVYNISFIWNIYKLCHCVCMIFNEEMINC